MKATSGRIARCILLAEDDEGVRTMLSIILEMWGYEVVSAADGVAALGLCGSRVFCLVITDYSMPRMCGDELAQNIKRLAPDQRILMLTAFAREARGRRNPVDQILTKPPVLQDLRTAVDQLAGGVHAPVSQPR